MSVVRSEREAEAMTNITYDPEADAVYITIGKGEFDHTEEAGLFIYDVDQHGRVLGIEILGATRLLAPGDWLQARLPGKARDAAE
jgi:uncharacterized protein YuzE